MLRWLLLLFTATNLTLCAVRVAAQDLPPGPDLEIGLDVAVAKDLYGGSGRPWGPRVLFNLSSDTALAIFGEVSVPKGRSFNYSWRSRLMGFEMSQVLAREGMGTASLIAGAGVSHRRAVYPQPIMQVKSQATGEVLRTITRPDRVETRLLPAIILGGGVGVRIGRHLSFHQDVRFVLAGDGSELRLQAGVTVPIGRYPRAAVATRVLEMRDEPIGLSDRKPESDDRRGQLPR